MCDKTQFESCQIPAATAHAGGIGLNIDAERKRAAGDELRLIRPTERRLNRQLVECAVFLGCLDGSSPETASRKKADDKGGKKKFASAHDLRRAFGTRWAKIVPPGILKELMRHSSIETTMNFYVSITATDTLAEVRRHPKKYGQVTEKPSEVTNEVTNRGNGTSSPETEKAVSPIRETALRQSHRSESN